MPSIESIGHPLVFKTTRSGGRNPVENMTPAVPGRVSLRTEVRAMEGMQKEAILHDAASDVVWRMVSDEGPYLNGTDLAPFPLGFFSSGMAFSLLSEVLSHARVHNVKITNLSLTQHNRYTMEGSAIRGDMTAGAIPVDMSVSIEGDAPDDVLNKIVLMAEASSPAQAYLRNQLESAFRLSVNGQELTVVGVAEATADLYQDPESQFDTYQPAGGDAFLPDIITKSKAAELTQGEGGAGSSLKAEQKRTLHVRVEARLIGETLKEVELHLLKPTGSSFRFLSDETPENGGKGVAPPALAYLSAGIGFCFMTQFGRYATITKQDLKSYRIVQDTVFDYAGDASDWSATATAEPVDTHVYLDFGESDEAGQQMLKMGKQTCFLHAAMAGSYPTRLEVKTKHSATPEG